MGYRKKFWSREVALPAELLLILILNGRQEVCCSALYNAFCGWYCHKIRLDCFMKSRSLMEWFFIFRWSGKKIANETVEFDETVFDI